MINNTKVAQTKKLDRKMRIHIRCTSTEEVIPFNYQPMLTGALHKWIGKNEIHNEISMYSFSWLMGADVTAVGLRFRDEGRFFISSFDSDVLKGIVKGIQSDPSIRYGLSVKEVVIQEDPLFKNETTFFCASPVFVKRQIDKNEIHFTYQQEEADQLLTETLKTKLRKAGLPDSSVSVQFDRSYHSPKTKLIYYNKIGNKVNICPVTLKGTPEQIAFAWNVGIGNCTGIGFGALK